MDIRYCKRCNTVYKYGNNSLCSNCLDDVEGIMLKIRAYLDDHPLAKIHEISEETGESEKDILYLLREGRLSVNDKAKVVLCARCGVSMESGKFCLKCIDQIKSELKGASDGFKDNSKKSENYGNPINKKGSLNTTGAKMHTSYRHKN